MADDPLFRIAGQTVVVTGGLGQLGQIFVKALRERGARVAVLDQVTEREEVADNLLILKTDITSREDVEKAYHRLVEVLGHPSGLINNAGIDSRPHADVASNGPFEDIAANCFQRFFAVNVTGAAICCQVIGGAMAARHGGSIVNIGSIYGQVAPDQRMYEYRRRNGDMFYKPAAYGASKAALDSLTKYLAVYWAVKHMRVNTLCLGGIKAQQAQEFLEQYESRVPMRRMGNVAEVIGPAIFLLSSAASYMTGAKLTLDGGFTAL